MPAEPTITRPDDWHIHLRDGAALATIVPAVARCFGRAIIMPNLTPPVSDARLALAYRERIIAQRSEGSGWQPLMVIYLTDNTSAETIASANAAGITAAKLYPAGATTNSDSGVTALDRIFPGHRLRAPREADQGDGLRLRRVLFQPRRDRTVCRGVRRPRRA